MTDFRTSLERAQARVPQPEVGASAIFRRLDRRHRRQRVAAGIVGMAIVAAGFLATSVIRSAPVPGSSTPTIRPATRERIVRAGEVVDVQEHGLFAVNMSTGDKRKLASCSDPCLFISADVAVSPDDALIAFRRESCVAGPCEPLGGIYILGASGETQITSCPECGGWFSWMRDGSRLLFTTSPIGARTAGDHKIMSVDPRGGDPRLLFQADGPISDLAWSADRSRLVFAVGSSVYNLDAATGAATQVVDAVGTVDGLDLTTDGTRIVMDVFTSGRDLVQVIRVDGSGLQTIGDQFAKTGPANPTWSPDGTRISYVSTPESSKGFAFEGWVVNADGTNPVRVFKTGCCIGDWHGPVWSPDGSEVAFQTDLHGYAWFAADPRGTSAPRRVAVLTVERWGQER